MDPFTTHGWMIFRSERYFQPVFRALCAPRVSHVSRAPTSAARPAASSVSHSNSLIGTVISLQQPQRHVGQRRPASICSILPLASLTVLLGTNPSLISVQIDRRAYLCSNTVYYDLMTQQCPRTCGRCTSAVSTTPSSITCVDLLNPSTGVSDCPNR